MPAPGCNASLERSQQLTVDAHVAQSAPVLGPSVLIGPLEQHIHTRNIKQTHGRSTTGQWEQLRFGWQTHEPSFSNSILQHHLPELRWKTDLPRPHHAVPRASSCSLSSHIQPMTASLRWGAEPRMMHKVCLLGIVLVSGLLGATIVVEASRFPRTCRMRDAFEQATHQSVEHAGGSCCHELWPLTNLSHFAPIRCDCIAPATVRRRSHPLLVPLVCRLRSLDLCSGPHRQHS